jgi:polysaccharide export outer membrane protein
MATRPADLLRPGDVITLKVWREPDWSGDFTVNESGVATFPRIGPVQVTAMSADSLRTFLVDSLRHFLKNPSIEVIPQRRIRVLGAVRNPGLYPVPATVTVGDAVAVAGGATQDGKPDQVKLRRNGQELMVDMARDTRLADTPVQTGDELFVPERSWVSRNAVLVGAGFSAVTTVLVAVLIQ